MNPDRLPILELRHLEAEGPAAYSPVLEEYAPVVTVRLWRSQPLPDLHKFSAIIAMGRPMGAHDGRSFPWIDEEIAYLRAASDAGVPVWGVCLGAQLLAVALGARVYTGRLPEVGVLELSMTDDAKSDPVWGDLPRVFSALQWHSDSFDLPAGALRRAGSNAYRNQLFRHGNSYGVQFHLEADGDLARRWLEIDEYVSALEQTLGAYSVPHFLAGIEGAQYETVKLARHAIRRWLGTVFANNHREVDGG